MSKEYPPRPTEMCEPVYIGTSNIGKRVSTKKYKQSWYVFFGYYRRGRIKRMRGITPNRWARIDKRIGHKRYAMIEEMNWEIFENTMFGITRWNRH